MNLACALQTQVLGKLYRDSEEALGREQGKAETLPHVAISYAKSFASFVYDLVALPYAS